MYIIDSLAILLDEAQVRNFERWPILDEHVWPNVIVGGTYEEEINYLKGWLNERLIWMDNNISGITSIGSLIEHNTMAEEFNLFQNYPNPFNPETVISWQLVADCEVDLSIYNLLGQKVATLASGKQKAGVYSVVWDATGFTSGVYIYRLLTDDGYSQIRKLVLIK
jgi:hypothetical protein